MKLLRRFPWDDRDSIYLPVVEDECEKSTGGMIRFTAIRIDGSRFVGAAFETTVSSMIDAKPYWKLAPNPKKPDKSIIIEVLGVPLGDLAKTRSRASKKDEKTDGQAS